MVVATMVVLMWSHDSIRGHASLYVYVRDTEDVHAQILDALLGAVADDGPGGWRERLKALVTGYGEVLRSHPEMARIALSTQPDGPNFMGVVEQILALLREGGADDRAAAWGVDLLLLLPTARAVEHNVEVPARVRGRPVTSTRGSTPTSPRFGRNWSLRDGAGQVRLGPGRPAGRHPGALGGHPADPPTPADRGRRRRSTPPDRDPLND